MAGQIGFDVHFDVDVPPQRVTTNHTNRGFGGQGTVPGDMGHDGKALWARDYETVARFIYYKNNKIRVLTCGSAQLTVKFLIPLTQHHR